MITIETIIESAKENAISCKMAWGMDDVDYAFATGKTHADGINFCVIGEECFEAVETGDCYGTRKPGDKIENAKVMYFLK